jgi:cell division septum initiation protein DivIVA
MELSPDSVSGTTFRIVKKGCDPEEVRTYLAQLAVSFEAMQKHAAAMEARARAATARLQEIAAQPAVAPAGPTQDEAADSISRAMLLAQRTADTTIREADIEATQIITRAKAEAQILVDSGQGALNRMLDEAKHDARKAAEGELKRVEDEVASMLARRDFLLSDVEHLEQHIVTQRERLRDVASALNDLVSRVPGGLADLRRPLISAVSEHNADTADSDDGDDDSDSEDAVEMDGTPAGGMAPPEPARAALLAGAEHAPLPMVVPDNAQELYDVTQPIPRVRFAAAEDLPDGSGRPG